MIEAVPQQTPSIAEGAPPAPPAAVTGAPAPAAGLRALIRGFRPSTTLFWGVHVAAVVGAIAYFSWTGVLLAIGSYFVRMFVVTAGYHRYFSHRAFKTSRVFQFLLALGAQSARRRRACCGGPRHHRRHHKHSDEPEDIHSARRSGFW